ncbi:SDR family oxidoreductase [Emticicia sp. BO119]|uniref:SDR family oxidoreductase n=1 Tax=Emticicia sp. BO119 TaxID=2757768 RepID=UPI0015F0F7AC|nr:SDR family oxidoreductase [Emticicia sp. BO119]MBA4852193.1 SDR family oxidoreductase [Emticicia sp. BO119]
MNKIILITGGSDGIGAVTAQLAAKEGYSVCINYHQNHIAANRIVEKINDEGGSAYAFQADISVESEVIDMFTSIDNQIGRITALVNNAGIIESQQKLVDMSGERLQKIFAINVIGSFLCAREAIKRMSVRFQGNGGSIVNISSMASRLGAPFEYIDYAATKGAIDSMTVGLSKEVAEDQIRVNVIRPGTIITDIHSKAGEPGRVDRVKEFIPMKRGGQPDEVAKAILWLLSDEASYITGATLDVSGGR